MYGTVGVINYERIKSVASAISSLGWDMITKLDELEPEYVTLKKFYDSCQDLRPLLVVGLGTAIIDYQLGVGGAHALWGALDKVLAKFNYNVKNLSEAKIVLSELLKYPVNARLRNVKLRRINRFFESGFAKYLWNEAWQYYNSNPMKIWRRLADAMHQKMSAKTIAFAMKVMDLISLIITGSYADFPKDPPIPFDVHVARMTYYSGIVNVPALTGDASERYSNIVRVAWSLVAEHVTKLLSRRVSVLRIDSLIWQLSKVAASGGYVRSSAQRLIAKYLLSAGAPEHAAAQVAEELTLNMM